MGRGAERKIVQNAIFHGKRHDNKISKVKILLSRNFVVMAQAPINGGGGGCKRGGFPIWTCPSFFVLFGDFPVLFLGFSRFARGWSGDFPDSSLFLFLGLLRAPTRNSPERVRDTIWTFPEKSGKHPGLETPRFSFSQVNREIMLQ